MFDKITVIGAGLMGAAIAAHFSNAGCTVNLLDLKDKEKKKRRKKQKNDIRPSLGGQRSVPERERWPHT